MITIVEGPDCSGKTTLIKNAFDFSGYVKHFGPPKGGPNAAWEQYTTALIEARITLSDWTDREHDMTAENGSWPTFWHIVFDRFCYGEMIYPDIMGRRSNFDEVQLRMIERVLLSMQSVLICALPSEETSAQLYAELKGREMIQDDDLFRQAFNHWRTFFSNHDIAVPTVPYDMELDSYADILMKANRVRTPKNKGPGIGMYSPYSTVMVGEQVNPQVDIWGWPFIEEGKAGSSYWLTSLLMNLGVSESSLYWVNSIDSKGKETPADFVKALRPKKLIAMGKPAQIWAKRNQLHRYTRVYEVSHPAFHKRFKSKDPYEIIDALKADPKVFEL